MFPVPIFSSNVGVDVSDIGHSLRFRRAQYLSKTITTSATSTYSFFVKRGKLGVISPIVESSIKFNANDTLTAFSLTTTAVFRDPTSWVHVHISNGGLYVNGVSLGAVTTSSVVNGRIGYDGTNYFDGYLARVCVVDGASSSYSNFGYLNTEINEWVSKSQAQVKAVVDAGGTNSFMLDFDNGTSLTTLGYDKSSKGNHWALNTFSLTAGATYDWMDDTPSNNFCTLNPLNQAGLATPANANLTVSQASNGAQAAASFGMSTGKWYYEHVVIAVGGENSVGIGASPFSGAYVGAFSGQYGYYSNGVKVANGGGAVAYGASYTDGDVIGVAYDADAGSLTFFKNGVSQGVAFTGISGTLFAMAATRSTGGQNSSGFNFGQRPFAYTPPTGFKALCQANLPAPAILDPTDHHTVITLTKSGDTNFSLPWNATDYDTLFWIKRRDAADDWYQIDGLRGYDKILKSNSVAAETTDANVLGVSGTTCTLKSTPPNGVYVVYAWKAGLVSARTTNTAGSITSTVSANQAAGFSIVTYTGTSANATVGHGLGDALKLVIVNNRAVASYWTVMPGDVNLFGGSYYLRLNTIDARIANSNTYTGYPTSTALYLSTDANVNGGTSSHVAYCFAEIPGYSKIDSYPGNGSTDGPYVECGFKPKFVMIKSSTAADDWKIYDAARPGYNVQGGDLKANTTGVETVAAEIDFTASGFKLRVATTPNAAQTYIFIAFADVPAKYSLSR